MTLPSPAKPLLVAAEDAELAGLVAAALEPLGREILQARSGRDAVTALARGPAVAILDLPSPDLGVPELLAACAHAGASVVAISGVYRGEKAGGELARLGARVLLEKPFDVNALVAAVGRALGAAAPAPPQGEAPDEVTGALPLAAEPAEISAAPVFALDAAPEPAPAPGPRVGFATPLPEVFRARAARPDAPPAASGTLSGGVARVLVALHVGQATGALTVTRGPVKKIVVVERGVPVYAASNVAAERFGAVCLRRGVVTAERLEALRAARPGARTAELLLEAGLLTPERRAELVTGQVRAVTWSTFDWRDGSYAFQLGRPPQGRVPIRLAMADLVLEGLLRTATLPRLRAELPLDAHLAPAPDPAFELYALRLRPQEAQLLALADGTKTVADLARLTELPERDALAFLHACRVMRVLDEVDRVLASTRRIGFM